MAMDPGVDDGLLRPGAVSARHWAAGLAHLKARAAWEAIEREAGPRAGGDVVLGADTIVVKEGEIIGQARDAADALRIVRLLEDGEHDVITGAAILADRGTRRVVLADSAHVRVGVIGAGRIADYVASGNWAGKAGAYNLAERLEAGWPIEYEGDPATIMGLPIRRLLPLLPAILPRATAATEGEATRC